MDSKKKLTSIRGEYEAGSGLGRGEMTVAGVEDDDGRLLLGEGNMNWACDWRG